MLIAYSGRECAAPGMVAGDKSQIEAATGYTGMSGVDCSLDNSISTPLYLCIKRLSTGAGKKCDKSRRSHPIRKLHHPQISISNQWPEPNQHGWSSLGRNYWMTLIENRWKGLPGMRK